VREWSRRPGLLFGAVTVTATVALAGAMGVAFAVGGDGHAGPQGDGTGITTVGWRVTPVGRQTTLGDKPFALAAAADGHFLVAVNVGQWTQSVQVIDTSTSQVTQTISYHAPEAVYGGITFSPDGRRLYVSGGGDNKVRVYDVSHGHLTETNSIAIAVAGNANPFPTGLAVSADGHTLYVADQLADAVSEVDLYGSHPTTTVPVGHNPYAVRLSADGRRVFVANQGANTVSVLDAGTGAVAATTTVGTHPDAFTTDRRGRLYVSNGDSDTVSVLDPAGTSLLDTIGLAPYPGAPVGSNPEGLTVSPDGRTLYVANAGDNDVAVVDLARPGHARVAGLIPTAWYPTGVALAGHALYVTNAKGLGAGPNPNGPNPYTDDTKRGNDAWASQYVGSMIAGTLSTIALPDRARLAAYTRKVAANDGFAGGAGGHAVTGTVVPQRPGGPSPIKHVIYVVKENRTYDQVFGSLGKGNGDPSIDLFGNDSAPNARALQRKFVTLDNFYAASEVSADGWNWSTAANANPYVQQSWLANYGGRNKPYDFEGGNLATAPNATPTDAYLWDRLSDAGVPYRNYGFFTGGGIVDPVDPVLGAHTDLTFTGYDLNCPDAPDGFTPRSVSCGLPRIQAWEQAFNGYVANDSLPTVEFVRLPNDHTHGTSPGFPTPRAYVADNDYALGRLVDDVSHSKYWSSTAIFVVEDDAQAGPDHVDAHRTIAQVISPYTQTGRVDSTFYSTVSMLRTIELLTGLRPLTQFDALATPMANSFTARPNLSPYTVVKPADSITGEVNGATAPLAAASDAQNFAKEDRADPQTLNQAIWQSVKGPGSTMPAPRGSTDTFPDADD
jgi:YVTN family beta-propeller protein